MALQPARRTADHVAMATGALLPHLFTRFPITRDGYFLLRGYPLSEIFPFGSAVPFIARTFLADCIRQPDKTACRYKNKK